MARKLGPLLIGALVASLALGGTSPTPAGAQDPDGVPVHLVHGSPDAASGEHPSLEVSIDGDVVATLEYGTPVDLVVAPGSRTFSVEASGGLLPVPVPIPETGAELSAGNGYTVVVSGDGTFLDLATEILVFENDLSSIATGVGRFTFNHAHFSLGALGDVSVDFGEAGSLEGISYGEGGTIELPEARYDAEVDIAGLVQEAAEIPIVGGVHIIATLIQGPDEPVVGADQDVEVLFLVQELPAPDTDVQAFCSVLLELSGLGDELFAALDTIGTADQLGQEEWRALFGRVDELLAQGDATRDLTVDDAWQEITAQLRMVRAAFALVDYDLTSEDGQQVAAEIQAALAEGGDDDGEDPALAALTEYVVSTCFAAATPPPAEEEPPAPAPAAEQSTLPRTGGPAALALGAGVLALAGLVSRSLLRRAA